MEPVPPRGTRITSSTCSPTRGADLAPAIVTLTEWGDRWAASDGPSILYIHAVCGGSITQQTTCANCGRVHDAAEVRVRPGPGMPADIAARMG
jgi:hypothetical protein